MDIYKSVKISIVTVIKNPEMLEFVPDNLKTKKKWCVSMQLKKLPFLMRYAPDQCKTQQMCDKAILENSGTLKFLPDCYKNQQLCDKAVDNHPHPLEFVIIRICHPLECYKTQNMCDEVVYTHPSGVKCVPWMLWDSKKCVIKQFVDVFCIWFYS